MTKEQILMKYEKEFKVHSIDPFVVFENMNKAALKAMDDWGKDMGREFVNFITKYEYHLNEDGLWRGQILGHEVLSGEQLFDLFNTNKEV